MQLGWHGRGARNFTEMVILALLMAFFVVVTVRGARRSHWFRGSGGLSRSVGCGPGEIVTGTRMTDGGLIVPIETPVDEEDEAGAPDGAPSAVVATGDPSSDASPGASGAVDSGTSSLCYGDVPCGPVYVRQPSPACAAAGANANWVVSVGPSTTGYAESTLALPDVGVRVADPDFGTCLVRATPMGWMNGYARFTAFNADSSRLLVRKAGGDWWVLDASTLGTPTLAVGVSGDPAAARWHGTDPDVLFYVKGTKLYRYQVSTTSATAVLDANAAPGLAGCGGVTDLSLGGTEGEASASSRFWGFQVTTASSCGGNTSHFLTADLATGDTWVHTLPSGVGLPDNSSMSPTGKYFIANFQGRACSGTGTISAPCGVMAYALHLDAATMAHPSAGHHDEALSKEGHDVVVVKSNVTDYIEAVDLETWTTTRIAAMNLSGAQAWDFHASGNNWAHPGWVVLSSDSFSWNTHYLSRQIVAVELADYATARVVHLAHHRTQSTSYWTQECHASVNADFTRIAWHTNWYGGSTEGSNYLVFMELPPGFLDSL